MGKLIYKKHFQRALIVLQILAAALFIWCFLNIGYWMDGSYNLGEMSKSYEQTDMFLRGVDQELYCKIRGQQNRQLFEKDGLFDDSKELDIQSYGTVGSMVLDLNTTYTLKDLIRFAENGGQERLHDAIEEAMAHQGEDGRDAGEILDEQAADLETILPVTGISLSECSRWYSNPSDFVLEMYLKLDEVSEEIYSRFTEYTEIQDETWSAEAPANLKYCIENTVTGELYTNINADSFDSAVSAVQEMEDCVSLYEGERSFNVMMTNAEHILNAQAENWFMRERFVSTNEKVYLAVDMTYPVNDILRIGSDAFAQRESIIWTNGVIAAVCGLFLLAGFILSVFTAGWEEGRCTPKSGFLDQVPTEVAAGIYMIMGVLYLLFFAEGVPNPGVLAGWTRLAVAMIGASGYFVFLIACLSLTRRIRMKTLWSNSVTLMLLRTWKQVTSARAASGQFLISYIIFVILSFVFLLLGQVGVFLMLVMYMVVLLYLLRDMSGKQSIYEGIHQISKGDLSYKIDTTALQGETLEMGKAVNEMGDGLQKAVDAIVKNERLKAELITNVSHDIKTPLTSIVNYVDLLKREHLEGERVQKYIEVLDQKSQRLRQLTEDLVEASKITSGNIELQLMKLPLQGMFQQAFGEFQDRFEERSLIPVLNIEKEPAFIMADGKQLWRVMENLLGNIYKYAMEGTRVYIEIYREDRTVYLNFQNTSREELTIDGEELIGRFVRGDKSRNTEGSGLGLSITQSLVQLHGGTFKVQADGDVFKALLTFPVVVDETEL